MAAVRIAAQMIAYQAVEAIEILPHVRRAGCNVDPRRRSKPEHRLDPVQYGQQTFQCSRIKSTAYFDPTPASQFNYESTIAPGDAVDILRYGGNHFDGNKRPASRMPSTLHALTIFIQRPYGQAPLLAKRCPHQSTRFKLCNQGLDLDQTTSPVHHSHFAHSSSPPLNAEQEQGALLRWIQLVDAGLVTKKTLGTQTLFSANEASPIFAEMRTIVAKTVGIRDTLLAALSPLVAKIDLAFVYGSVARSREGQQSDVDLMIVGGVHFADVVDRIANAQKTLNREINPTVYTANEFRGKLRGNFLKTVLGENKLFLIGDEDVLRKLGQ
jgi:predicted nucleotidyltransferase